MNLQRKRQEQRLQLKRLHKAYESYMYRFQDVNKTLRHENELLLKRLYELESKLRDQ